MSLHVACCTCHATFPLETHAGLVRCSRCTDLAVPRLTRTQSSVIEFAGTWA